MSSPAPVSVGTQRQAVTFLLRLNDHPDDPALRVHLDQWLQADPAHARAWARAQRAWAATGEAAPAAAARMPAMAVRRRLLPRWAAMAAMLLLAVIGTLTWNGDDWSAGPGEITDALLPDGSRVTLDSGSGLDVAIAGESRQVTLTRGEALFQVAHDPARPFRVRVGEVTVTVLGTVFDLRLDDETVAVAVASGRVRIDGADGRRIDLTPGQRLHVDRRGGGWTTGLVDVDAIAAWRDGRLLVDDASLAQLAQALNRHTRAALVIRDAELAQRRITGVFDLRNPAAALKAAAAPHGGVVRDWGGWVLTLNRT